MITPKWLRIVAAVLVALAAGLGAYTQVDTSSPPASQDARSSWGAVHAEVTPRATAPPVAQVARPGVESNLVEPGEEELGRLPLAANRADSIAGCETDFTTHNFNTRGGTPIREIGIHYTVSRAGSGPVIVAMWKNPATKASSNLVIDADGRCWYVVPLNLKSWTEVAGNPFTASIEFVAYGDEGKLTAAEVAKGGQVIAQIAARYKIPLQLGDVTGCQPVEPGVVDHAMYGGCGGGHHDLRPFYGSHVPRRSSEDAQVLAPLIAAAKSASEPAASTAALSKGEKAAAGALERERAIAKRHGGWTKIDPSHLQRAVDAKNALRRANERLHAAAAKTGWDKLNRRARHARIHALI